MAERHWHSDVVPVQRMGWSDDGVVGARTDPVTIARGRRADPLVLAAIGAGLIVVLLKPWGAPGIPLATPVAADVHRVAVPARAAAASVTPLVLPPLPAQVFAPAARTCMEDVAWRVCVLDAAGATDQGTRNHFAPDAPALTDDGGSPRAADPLIVLATTTGATIAFYAPGGFYIPDSSQVPRPTDLPGGLPAIASGPVAISAWYVDDRSGSLTLALLGGAPLTQGGRVAANVYVPGSERFSALGAWSPGRYIVWIKGAGSRPWQQFFDFDVIGGGVTTPR